MGRFHTVVFCVSLILLLHFSSSALAFFSFEKVGTTTNFYYGSVGQLGGAGFFGPYNSDNRPLAVNVGRFAPLNGWVGNVPNELGELTAGSNAAHTQISTEVKGSWSTSWIEVQGKYVFDPYESSTAPGTYVTMSPANITMWSFAAKTPIGKFAYGKIAFGQGFGLQFAQARSADYFVVERSFAVPDIVLRLVNGGMLPRSAFSYFNPASWIRVVAPEDPDDVKAMKAQEDAENNYFSPAKVPPLAAVMGNGNSQNGLGGASEEDMGDDSTFMEPPYAMAQWEPARLTMGYGFSPWQGITSNGVSWNSRDMNAAREQNLLVYLLYTSRDLMIGAGTSRTVFHQGPELVSNIFINRDDIPTRNDYLTEGWAFLQYNNGRFFFNTELDWYNLLVRFQRSRSGLFDNRVAWFIPVPTGSGISPFAPRYTESWRFMTEIGCQFGTINGRVLYAFMPGPDRRRGYRINRQPFIQADEQAAYGIFEPYSILMSRIYGGGVGAPSYLSDATVLGARFDYAVAANLILSGSVLHARRNSHGYGLGYIRPDTTSANRFGRVLYGVVNEFTANPASPAIPNTDLGWEVVGGVTWELLDGWTFETRLAWWQPGRWFNYACVDKSIQDWDNPRPINNWGVNPDRRIDPVMSLELRIGASLR